MCNKYEEAKRDVIRAVIDAYHKTRLAGPLDEFIASDERVEEAFKVYALMYASG